MVYKGAQWTSTAQATLLSSKAEILFQHEPLKHRAYDRQLLSQKALSFTDLENELNRGKELGGGIDWEFEKKKDLSLNPGSAS